MIFTGRCHLAKDCQHLAGLNANRNGFVVLLLFLLFTIIVVNGYRYNKDNHILTNRDSSSNRRSNSSPVKAGGAPPWHRRQDQDSSPSDIFSPTLPTREPLPPLLQHDPDVEAFAAGAAMCQKYYQDLSAAQYEKCRRSPDVTGAALEGVQLAVTECLHQFRPYRWNCSTLDRTNSNKSPFFSVILTKGYKETAFAHSIIAAGMVTQITNACSQGRLPSCPCRLQHYRPRLATELEGAGGVIEVEDRWKWSGCDEGVSEAYAKRFARHLLEAREKASDLLSRVRVHNNKVGLQVGEKNSVQHCKCHGTSGACDIKTCWVSLPPFRDIGTTLKQLYNKAVKIEKPNSNKVKLRPEPSKRKNYSPRTRQHIQPLLYYETSPDFCERDPGRGSPGTIGRRCNRTVTSQGAESMPGVTTAAEASDSCETLCCGRGYDTLKIVRVERCNCFFKWCCNVSCQQCRRSEWITICK